MKFYNILEQVRNKHFDELKACSRMGMIINIQKFCINDGPGIRTTVFFKGCGLHCKWCHNPESHSYKPDLLFDTEKCIGCGRCGDVCPQNAHIFDKIHTIDRKKCINCGICVNECDFDVLELAGKEVSVQEVMDEVLKDKIFYDNSGGGLTLSGGEPLMQFDFAYELLKQAKLHGIHTCIETCGFAKAKDIIKIAEVTDIFLYDWKITGERLHEIHTGVKNFQIRDNLMQINTTDSKVILRCPIIPNVNDTNEHFQGIADIANSLKNILAIEIEPYHSLGNHKYIKLGKSEAIQNFEQPTEQQVENWIMQIQKQTKTVVKRA